MRRRDSVELEIGCLGLLVAIALLPVGIVTMAFSPVTGVWILAVAVGVAVVSIVISNL